MSDIAIWLFQGIIKDFEKKLNPIIGNALSTWLLFDIWFKLILKLNQVPAMLEQESLPGMRDNKSNNLRTGQAADAKNSERYTIDSLIKKLTEFLNILNSHGVDPEIVNQIFKQVIEIKLLY